MQIFDLDLINLTNVRKNNQTANNVPDYITMVLKVGFDIDIDIDYFIVIDVKDVY